MSNINNFNLTSGTGVLDLGFAESYLHDASSFYNFEQDNIPLVKLLSRTDLLYQYAGFPGDEVRPTTLTLSSVADPTLGVYDTIDDIARRIPQRLTFPLIIELCDYGNLGALELDGISTIGDGQLHIINRLHSFDAEASATTVANFAVTPAGSVASPTVINTVTARTDFETASSIRVGNVLFDNTELAAEKGRLFVTKYLDTEEESDRTHFYLSFEMSGGIGATTNINGSPYTSSVDNSIDTDDINAKDFGGTGSSLELGRTPVSTAAFERDLALNVYGNYFTSVRVRNCHGSIKLTGICADSASGSDATASALVHYNDYGFDIRGSDILLEHTAACRAAKAGYFIRNSEVGVLGSMIAHRIYPREVGGSRTANVKGIGVHAVQSTICYTDTALGTTADADYNRFNIISSRCDYGYKLEKSTIEGGTRNTTGKSNAAGTDTTTSIIQAYQNTEDGIYAADSEITYLGRLDVFNNKRGVHLNKSTLRCPQFTVDDNQGNGIHLVQGTLLYGWRLDELNSATIPDGDLADATKNKVAYHVSHNGVNLLAERNSQVEPHYTGTSGLPAYLGKWGGHDGGSTFDGAMSNHGSKTGLLYDEPSVIVKDNSHLELVNPSFRAEAVAPVKGRCVHVLDNSYAALRGTTTSHVIASLVPDNGANFTNAGLVDSFQSAAFCAESNSKIELSGPVKVSRFGVAGLSEDNSVFIIRTPTAEGGSIPDTFKYTLETVGNQTKVELHSTRACLVANRDSGVVLHSIGGIASSLATTIDPRFNNTSLIDTSLSSVWSGVMTDSYVQFYPNPFTSAIVGTGFHEATVAAPFSRTARLIASGSEQPICGGGMVVRAVGGSYVDVNAVNFNFSMPASSVSGSIYSYTGSGVEWVSGTEPGSAITIGDFGYALVAAAGAGVDPYTGLPLFDSGGSLGLTTLVDPVLAASAYSVLGYPNPCSGYIDPSAMGSRLQLWNISDTSRIHVTNVRINKGDPRGISDLSGYHGPSGKWPNGVALDYFGKWGTATTYNGDNTFRNYGIFRIMLGHRGDLKSYFAASGTEGTGNIVTIGRDTGGYPIDQINSQGYLNITMDASAIPGSDSRRIAGVAGGANFNSMSLSGYDDVFGWGRPAMGQGVPALLPGDMTSYRQRHLNASSDVLISATPGVTFGANHMDWQGYMRNFLDESGANLFSNAKHLSLKGVGGVSIYRSTHGPGGEGRDGDTVIDTFGVGIRSLNIFDLNRLI